MKKLLQFFATFLLCGVLSLSVAAQENLIRNGDFTEPIVEQGWVSIHDIENTPEGEDEFWHVQFNQGLTEDQIDAIEVGETYELTFDAKADDVKEIAVFFGEDGGDFHNLLDPDQEDVGIITLTMEEQNFTLEFEANTFDAMKLGFEGGMCDVDYSIGNVSILKKVEEDEDAGDNIVNNGHFGPADFEDTWFVWYADWYDPPITVSVSINDWFLWFADWHDPVIAVDLTIDEGWANVHNIENNPGDEIWYVQFNQGLTASQIDTLVTGGEYTLTFDAKAEDEKEVAVFFGEDGGSYHNLLDPDEEGVGIITLTMEEQNFTFDFEANTFDAMKLGFEGGLDDIGFSISNVEILLEDLEAYGLTVSVEGEGTTDPGPGTHYFASGSEVELTATPEEDYEFEKWVINGDEFTEATTNVTIEDSDVEAVAHFVEIQVGFEVTLNVDMADAVAVGDVEFDPDIHDVWVTGTFADWAMPGENVDFQMQPGDGAKDEHEEMLYPGNWTDDTEAVLGHWADDGGPIFGTNTYGDAGYGQIFEIDQEYHIDAAKFWIGSVAGETGDVVFTIWDYADGSVGEVLGDKTIPLADINASEDLENAFTVQFDEPVYVDGDFLIGADISDLNAYDPDVYELANIHSDFGAGGGAGLALVLEGTNWVTILNYDVDVDVAIFPILAEDDAEEDIYTITFDAEEGDHEYKYFIVEDEPTWDLGEWEGDPNRELTVEADMVVDEVWADLVTSIDEIDEDQLLTIDIYPNPASSQLHVDSRHEIIDVSVYDITGRMLIQQTEDVINVSGLRTGVYIIQVNTSEGIEAYRFNVAR